MVVDHLEGRRIRADDEQFLMWQTFFLLMAAYRCAVGPLPSHSRWALDGRGAQTDGAP